MESLRVSDIADRALIDQIRLSKSKFYLITSIVYPLITLAIIIFCYEGFGFCIPKPSSVFISMILYCVLLFFIFLSISRFYKENYDGFVTYLSLYLLFWFSSFIVFPYRYEVDTLVLYIDSIFKGTLISIMFSSVAIIPFLFLLWYRKRYEDEKSIAATIIVPLLVIVLFVDSILYFIVYRNSIYMNNFILVMLVLVYDAIVATLAVISFMPSKVENFDRIWFSLFIALIVLVVVLFTVGLLFGDYISHRSYFIGGLYAIFAFIPYSAMLVAFYRSYKWNRSLFVEESNSDNAEFTYYKA